MLNVFLLCAILRVGRETMIGYVTLGTRDLGRAAVFYDAIAAEMGTGRTMLFDGFIAWGKPEGTGVCLTSPFDGQPASVGNGVIDAIAATATAQRQRLHDIALVKGGRDEGG